MSHTPRRPRRRVVALGAVLATAAALAAVTTAEPAQAVGETLSVTLTKADGSANLSPQASITLGAVTTGSPNVVVNDSITSQTISGFGASFTNSSTYLLSQLKTSSPSQYSSLMNDIFNTSTGLGESFWRLPMTSSDFTATSTHYTSDDTAGPSSNPTQNFALTSSETGYIIPVIKDALAINPNLQIVASPWSAPAWMKTPQSIFGTSGGVQTTLNPTYNQAWADYFVKWIKAYQTAGVPIFAVTPQNEPLYTPSDYPGMKWDATALGSWIHSYLKPSLTSAGLSTPILGFDHNWEYANPDQGQFPQALVASAANPDLAGTAWHCYDNTSDPAAMTLVHNQYPSKDAYETECSSDVGPSDIIRYGTADMALLSTQNWAKSVVLWNLALTSSGGPHLGGCNGCKGMISIDGTTVTKTGIYYQLAQLAKFVKPGAVHISSTVNARGIVTSAFKNPNGQEVLVATNTNATNTTFTATWNGKGSFAYTLTPRATATFVGSIGAATAQPTTPGNNRVFRIVSRVSGKPFGVEGSSTANGAKIVQYTDSGDRDQQWRFVDAGSGYYNIVNVNSGAALDNPSGSTTNGTQVQQYAISGTGNSNQQWAFTSVGSGFYKITNRTSGLGLDLTGGTLTDSTYVQQYSVTGNGNFGQNWQLVPVG
ncbi:RICIN domain-containing protein [Jatrophihabitans sp. YIM 134969]